ncbi:uncharacterized protein LOC134571064 isoform X2 [Pelobates fuscus]|uniref:uncharacterized protein LOC134571064 isoform X2 n=1 Tax=Pelobates fuscus TaxID=191477 RepID=UPI002FE44B4C
MVKNTINDYSKGILFVYFGSLVFHILSSYSKEYPYSLFFVSAIIIVCSVSGAFIIIYCCLPSVTNGSLCVLSLVLIGIEAYIVTWILETNVIVNFMFILLHVGTGACFLISYQTPSNDVDHPQQVVIPSTTKIFSRSGEEEYCWLTNSLQKTGNVSPFFISNNNFSNFREAASRCTFAILYHSKTRGRLNITDVKDSLYDKELEYLSRSVGKNRVVVVIDDLEDSGFETKCRILEHQPSLSRLAKDVFLFTSADKQSGKLWNKVEPIIALIR